MFWKLVLFACFAVAFTAPQTRYVSTAFEDKSVTCGRKLVDCISERLKSKELVQKMVTCMEKITGTKTDDVDAVMQTACDEEDSVKMENVGQCLRSQYDEGLYDTANLGCLAELMEY